MVVYGVLATLCLMSLYKSDDFDLPWYILLIYSICCLVPGALATWVTNGYFIIEKWPAKGQRNWEIPLAVTAGLLVCIFLGLIACTTTTRIIFLIFVETSAMTLLALASFPSEYIDE